MADLSHNRLAGLPSSALCSLCSLASLKLSHNCLQVRGQGGGREGRCHPPCCEQQQCSGAWCSRCVISCPLTHTFVDIPEEIHGTLLKDNLHQPAEPDGVCVVHRKASPP